MKGNFAAIVLVLLGTFFLLNNLGMIDISLLHLLKIWWPLILIVVGVMLFFLPRKGSQKMKGLASLGGLVYSTEHGRMCPDCRQPQAQCVCKVAPAPQGDGTVRVSRETKGRGGKAVTVIKGVLLESIALAQLGKQLKAACGSGGTVKDGVIEVQGDHVAQIISHLQKQGHTVKKVGG